MMINDITKCLHAHCAKTAVARQGKLRQCVGERSLKTCRDIRCLFKGFWDTLYNNQKEWGYSTNMLFCLNFWSEVFHCRVPIENQQYHQQAVVGPCWFRWRHCRRMPCKKLYNVDIIISWDQIPKGLCNFKASEALWTYQNNRWVSIQVE